MSSRSPPSPPHSPSAPSGRGGLRAPFLADELFGAEKSFFGKDCEFPKGDIVGEKSVTMEMEGEGGGKECSVVLVTITEDRGGSGGRLERKINK